MRTSMIKKMSTGNQKCYGKNCERVAHVARCQVSTKFNSLIQELASSEHLIGSCMVDIPYCHSSHVL